MYLLNIIGICSGFSRIVFVILFNKLYSYIHYTNESNHYIDFFDLFITL